MTNIIDNLEKVSYNMREIAKLKKTRSELESLAYHEIERVNEWLASETKTIDADIEYRESNIIGYYQIQRQDNPKFKLSTPWGKVKSRKMQPKYNIIDEQTVINQCRELGLDYCIHTKTIVSLDKMALKTLTVIDGKLLDTATGAYLEGVVVEHQEDKITLEVE